MLRFSAKLYKKVLGLAVTPDPRVIFIILIITLNLHDPRILGVVARSCHKSVLIK